MDHLSLSVQSQKTNCTGINNAVTSYRVVLPDWLGGGRVDGNDRILLIQAAPCASVLLENLAVELELLTPERPSRLIFFFIIFF